MNGSAAGLTERKRNNMEYFKLGELFCGPGGLAYGAVHAQSSDNKFGVVHVWANDNDDSTCRTYRHNICRDDPGSVVCCDVRDFPIDNMKPIDAFAYGFPCNSFSVQGEHKGIENEEYGSLYLYGIKVLEKFRPKWFIAENVSGIRTAGSSDFQTILGSMRACGYKLNIHLYRAEEYGVPQIRHRYIIVGIRDDLDVEFRIPSTEPYKDVDVSAETALANIPYDAFNNEQKQLTDRVIGKLIHTRPGQNIWQAMRNPDFPDKYKIKEHYSFSQIYRKLDPRKPSYTLTANGGGGTWGYYWYGARELTNRERARIQTFPDDYWFAGNYSQVRRQIGMAVPCKLANIVTTAILDSFAKVEYQWIPMTEREKELAEGTAEGSDNGRHDKETAPEEHAEDPVERYKGGSDAAEGAVEERIPVQEELGEASGMS